MRTLDRRHHSHPLLDFAIDGNVGMWNENAGSVYNAREYRRLLERLMGFDVVATPGTGSGGIFREGDLAVTQRGAGANMSVDVALGATYVDNNASSTGGGYFVYSDATVNVPITASDPTNPRKDLIGVAVRDTEYAGATNDAQVTVITGTAAGVPSEPSIPATYHGWVTLALVDVAAAAASITNANITDRRRRLTALGGTIVAATDSVLPTVDLWAGQVALVISSAAAGNLPAIYFYTGSAWAPLGQAARSWTWIASAAPSAAIVDFTSIPATFTHLLVILTGRGNAGLTIGNGLVRFGTGGGATDTGANYDLQYLDTNGAVATANFAVGQTSLSLLHVPGTTATAAKAGTNEFLVADYRSTTYQKTVLSSGGYFDAGVGGSVVHRFGVWRNTAAIDRIALHFNAIGTGWVAGTKATLLGQR